MSDISQCFHHLTMLSKQSEIHLFMCFNTKVTEYMLIESLRHKIPNSHLLNTNIQVT